MQASYKAWVRHDGTHETKAQGFRRWNDEILQQMNRELGSRWVEFMRLVGKSGDELVQLTLLELSLLSVNMRGKCALMGISQLDAINKHIDLHAPQSLVTTVKLKERELRYLLQEEYTKMVQEIGYDSFVSYSIRVTG